MAADQELFDSWFRFADADRDNVIGGADAVSFFSRSGLPQETLFKVSTREKREGAAKMEKKSIALVSL